ncbi:hypothetical protein BAU15_03530 [Enterococcus sp. JM4C]|uniref:DUF6287 domain-containing protein n=1 Tax=Candidatus Enterococcus huntleyi TaxID=1857217 RepID=UPI00137A158A|nr:DUF6287 domain-containing protein [Enterococcus sp. JM4C]KAF1295623.1 hypothetical protein BAU15_03530 [Enterococcus sp. JM4C]
MKKKIGVAVVVVIVLVVGVFGYIKYDSSQKEKVYNAKIEKIIAKVEKESTVMSEEKDSTKKLELLKETQKALDEYKQGQEKDKAVIRSYDQSIKSTQEWFKNENDTIIKANTSEEIDKEKQDSLQKKDQALTDVLQTIHEQKEVVYTEKEIENKADEINELKKKYEDRMKELDKKSAEEKAKKEAEDKENKEKEERESAQKETSGMNLKEIESGNYSSVNGTWKNGNGQIIEVTQNTIEIAGIHTGSNEPIPATIKELTIDIPSKNDAEGNPAKQEWIEGEIDSYGQELTGYFYSGFLILRGNIPMAMLCVSFVPVGVVDESQGSDVNKERIVAVITQSNPTSVPEEQFYYRVDSNDTENEPVEAEKLVITEETVLEYAENYVKEHAPIWEGSFIYEGQLPDGSFDLFYDSRGAARGKFIIGKDGQVTRLDRMGNVLKSIEEMYK